MSEQSSNRVPCASGEQAPPKSGSAAQEATPSEPARVPQDHHGLNFARGIGVGVQCVLGRVLTNSLAVAVILRLCKPPYAVKLGPTCRGSGVAGGPSSVRTRVGSGSAGWRSEC